MDLQNHDVILYGKHDPSKPLLHIDDLVVAIRNQWQSYGQFPGCSIDPRVSDLRNIQQFVQQAMSQIGMNPAVIPSLSKQWRKLAGPQDVRVFGIPKNSRMAKVIVDADYKMKKLAAGTLSVEGLSSYLDYLSKFVIHKVKLSGGAMPPMKIMSRFWFYPDDTPPSYSVSDNILQLSNCKVKLLTEEEHLGRSGNRFQTGRAEENAAKFVLAVSQKYAQIAAKYSIYADMENIFRLVSTISALHHQNDLERAGLSFNYWLNEYSLKPVDVPTTLPGFTHDKQVPISIQYGSYEMQGVLWIPMSGGVMMKFDLSSKQFSTNNKSELDEKYASILSERPSNESLSWTFGEERPSDFASIKAERVGNNIRIQLGNKQITFTSSEISTFYNNPNSKVGKQFDELIQFDEVSKKDIIFYSDKSFDDESMTNLARLTSGFNRRYSGQMNFYLDDNLDMAIRNFRQINLIAKPKDIVILVPQKSFEVNDYDYLNYIEPALEKIKISVVRTFTSIGKTPNVLLISGHNNQQLINYLEHLGENGALKEKIVLIITCYAKSNPKIIHNLIAKYGATGFIYVPEEMVNPLAVANVLEQIDFLLTEAEQQGRTIHANNLLWQAAERALINKNILDLAIKNYKQINFITGSKDMVILVPEKSFEVNDYNYLNYIKPALARMKINVVQTSSDVGEKPNVLIISGHNNQQLINYLEHLGKNSTLKGKMIILNTCYAKSNPKIISNLVAKYEATGFIYLPEEKVNPLAVAKVLEQIDLLLTEVEQQRSTIHPNELIRQAVEKALKESDSSIMLKNEINKFHRSIMQISEGNSIPLINQLWRIIYV